MSALRDLTGTPTADPTDQVTDTGTDTGVDTGTDTGVDTGTDTGVDTGTDTGVDTGTDTGTAPVELVAEGGFADGTGWSGNALNIVDGVSRADVGAAGEPDVNLSAAVR